MAELPTVDELAEVLTRHLPTEPDSTDIRDAAEAALELVKARRRAAVAQRMRDHRERRRRAAA